MPRTCGPSTNPSATYSAPEGSPTPRTTRPLTRKLPMYESTSSPMRTTSAFIPRSRPERDLLTGERFGDRAREAGLLLARHAVACGAPVEAHEVHLRARREGARRAQERVVRFALRRAWI